jgi:hypothetical protein
MIDCIYYCELKAWAADTDTFYEYSLMISKKIPFCPPIGIEILFSDFSWKVESVAWIQDGQELSINLDKSLVEFDDLQAIIDDLDLWVEDGWKIESGIQKCTE